MILADYFYRVPSGALLLEERLKGLSPSVGRHNLDAADSELGLSTECHGGRL